MAQQPHFPLPLPKGWPRRVRSAAVHAIALARLALATTRGQTGKANVAHGAEVCPEGICSAQRMAVST